MAFQDNRLFLTRICQRRVQTHVFDFGTSILICSFFYLVSMFQPNHVFYESIPASCIGIRKNEVSRKCHLRRTSVEYGSNVPPGKNVTRTSLSKNDRSNVFNHPHTSVTLKECSPRKTQFQLPALRQDSISGGLSGTKLFLYIFISRIRVRVDN